MPQVVCHAVLHTCWRELIGEGSAGGKIVYTYDTFWELSDISWASRWDAYLKMPGGRVHWFSILNSLMVVLVMSSIVAMIMLRTIRRDLARYEGLLGETGEPLPAQTQLSNLPLRHSRNRHRTGGRLTTCRAPLTARLH